eukprot:SAG31_NODE_30210_length_384_cov_0.743860_1_plen_26_part_01
MDCISAPAELRGVGSRGDSEAAISSA